MQKKLIALALASLAGSAFAQSNVTIYGVADATFDNIKATNASAGSAFDTKARNRVASNSSYIGFKGVEDLGNGLKAAFQLEQGVNFDGTAVGNAWGNRDSYVGIAGGFGTVVAGNVTGPTRALGAKLDVNSGATGVGANTALLGKLGGTLLGGQGAGAFDQRINNAVAYISPNFSGFNAVVGYSTGLGGAAPLAALNPKEGNALNAGPFANGAVGANVAWTAGVNYENGPIYAGLAYTTVKADGSDNDVSNTRLGGAYKFGTAGQVGLLWDRTVAQGALATGLGATAGNLKATQNVYYVSGKFNVTPAGAIIAQYGRAADVKNDGAANLSARHYEVGYEHSLSKRTVLKVVWSEIKNKDGRYDFLYGVNNATNTTASAAGVSAGADPRALSLGIRHSF